MSESHLRPKTSISAQTAFVRKTIFVSKYVSKYQVYTKDFRFLICNENNAMYWLSSLQEKLDRNFRTYYLSTDKYVSTYIYDKDIKSVDT